MTRIVSIAVATFREAVRDRVLYNLIFFALLLVAAALLVGQISIGIEEIVLVNLGLTAIALFGIVIAIFIGIGLVYKEIEKRTLHTVLSRPVRRWEFIAGKFFGLTGTLLVNMLFMAVGFFAALYYLTRSLDSFHTGLFVAMYFIILEFVVVTALALLFSSFSSPLLSAVMTFALFVIGTFAEDLRAFAEMSEGATRWISQGVAWVVPNLASLNVVTQVAHRQPVPAELIVQNTFYVVCYAGAALCGAILIFQRRNLK
jgi:ABC-type transport system involved in multi-copper enzyme maturation permease subunit